MVFEWTDNTQMFCSSGLTDLEDLCIISFGIGWILLDMCSVCIFSYFYLNLISSSSLFFPCLPLSLSSVFASITYMLYLLWSILNVNIPILQTCKTCLFISIFFYLTGLFLRLFTSFFLFSLQYLFLVWRLMAHWEIQKASRNLAQKRGIKCSFFCSV